MVDIATSFVFIDFIIKDKIYCSYNYILFLIRFLSNLQVLGQFLVLAYNQNNHVSFQPLNQDFKVRSA